jgi:hypothetical protein
MPESERFFDSFLGNYKWKRRACKVVGRLCCDHGLACNRDGPEAPMPMAECIFEGSVQYVHANIEEAQDRVMIPPHLLFLGHALCNDVVYQRSDSGTVSTKTSRALSHLNFFLSSGQPTLRGSAQEQTTGQPRGYRGHVYEIKSHLTISSTIVIRSSIEVFNCNY